MFNRSRNKIILSIMGALVLLFVITLSVILFASYREIQKKSSDIIWDYIERHSLEKVPGDPAVPAVPDDSVVDSGSGSAAGPAYSPGSGAVPGASSDSGSGAAAGPAYSPGSGAAPGASSDFGSEPAGGSDPSAGAGSNSDSDSAPEVGPREKDFPEETRDYQLSTLYSVAFATDGSVLDVDNEKGIVYSDEDLIGIAEDIREKNETSGKRGLLLFQVAQKDGYVLVAFMDNTVTDSSMHTLLRYVLIVGSAAIILVFFISLFLSKLIIKPLEENDRKQKQFISDAGHELKTPVSVISANAEMLSRELGKNEWLSNIQYENDRMGELVKQLLDLSRAESAEVPMEQVDLSRIVTGEVLAFESLAFEKGKTIQSNIEDEIRVAGIQTQLAQLVSVLLDNAVRHSTGDTIDLSLTRQAHTAVLCVSNESEEIPPEKLEHLFDRFYRVDEARNSEGHHYGLGLSIARAVAERHGGKISVSCHDKRVVFAVSIPIR